MPRTATRWINRTPTARSPRKSYGVGGTRAHTVARIPVSRKSRKVGRLHKRPRYTRKTPKKWAMWSNPMARDAFVKMNYIDDGFDLTTLALGGYTNGYTFKSSPYDPDHTGIGVQPYGYANILSGTAFKFYQVLAMSAKLTFYVGEACHQGTVSLIPIRNGTLSYVDRSDLRAIPGVKQRNISTDTKNPVYLKCYRSTRQIAYAAGSDPGDVDWTGNWNGNPVNNWYIHVYFDTTSIAQETTAYFDIKISYYLHVMRRDDEDE